MMTRRELTRQKLFRDSPISVIAAYGFLIFERGTIPPSRDRATTMFPQFAKVGHLG
jgi:hypothetical protein